MTVTLFVPCFVDALFPQVGINMVRILEKLGHRVECPEQIACCGQPAFNSGYWDEARCVAEPTLKRLKNAEAVVIASGSCGAMLKVFYPQLFAGQPDRMPAFLAFELQRQYAHADEVRAMDSFEALCNDGANTEQTRALRRPVAR